jgi:hypothetical protein
MSVWIVYAPAILFFLALPIAILLVMKDPRKPSEDATQEQSVALSRMDKTTYGALAALLVFLCIMTVLTERKRSRTGASKPLSSASRL